MEQKQEIRTCAAHGQYLFPRWASCQLCQESLPDPVLMQSKPPDPLLEAQIKALLGSIAQHAQAVNKGIEAFLTLHNDFLVASYQRPSGGLPEPSPPDAGESGEKMDIGTASENPTLAQNVFADPEATLRAQVSEERENLKLSEVWVRKLKDSEAFKMPDTFPGQRGEMIAQSMLAVRAIEEARMRLGKVLQYAGDGVSIYDKA